LGSVLTGSGSNFGSGPDHGIANYVTNGLQVGIHALKKDFPSLEL
jgi:hypothetical protein